MERFGGEGTGYLFPSLYMHAHPCGLDSNWPFVCSADVSSKVANETKTSKELQIRMPNSSFFIHGVNVFLLD